MIRSRADPHHPAELRADRAGVVASWRRGPRILGALVALLSVACFPKEPGKHLEHFATIAPQASQPAPDFELRDLDGESVRLSERLGERPVVLQLGSHSCPVYRYRNKHYMSSLWEGYEGEVDFFVVYTREAHPVGSPSPFTGEDWDTIFNRATGVRVRDATTYDERRDQARDSRDRLELPVPVLVDSIDNSVWHAYGEAASPAFVIDTDGNIADAMPWIDPARLREVLDRLLGR